MLMMQCAHACEVIRTGICSWLSCKVESCLLIGPPATSSKQPEIESKGSLTVWNISQPSTQCQ